MPVFSLLVKFKTEKCDFRTTTLKVRLLSDPTLQITNNLGLDTTMLVVLNMTSIVKVAYILHFLAHRSLPPNK